MTVDYAYRYLQFLARKNQTVQIKPEEFHYAINKSQRDFYDFLVGGADRLGREVGLGSNNRVSSALSPFKVTGQSVSVTSNIAPYPTNYQILALITDANGKKVEWLSDDKIPSRLNSAIDNFEDVGKSFYTEEATGFKIYGTANPVLLTYYTSPPYIVWGYVTGSITSVPVLTGGSGYTSATVTFSAPPAGGITATATVNITSGVVTGITMTNIGSGYVTAPTVTFSGVGGSSCTLGTAVVNSRPAYYAQTSVQPLWDNNSMEDILSRAARVLGISFEKGVLIQMGERDIEKGE
jgi:hypothetical protein